MKNAINKMYLSALNLLSNTSAAIKLATVFAIINGINISLFMIFVFN